MGSKKHKIISTWSASHTMDSTTSNGYSIVPSTSPGRRVFDNRISYQCDTDI